MAKFSSTKFGKISGKHGTAVSATLNGESILKVFSPSTNPNTPAQQEQRLKFGLVTTTLQPLRQIASIGFGSRRGIYDAISIALRNAIKGDFPNFTIDFSKVVLSSGTLPKSAAVSVAKGAGNQATVTWDTAVWNLATPQDWVYIAFLEENDKMSFILSEKLLRSAGNCAVEFPALFASSTVHGWIFFVSPGGDQRSVSQYLGSIAL